MKLFPLLAAAALLSGCATTPPEAPATDFYVMRHLEKEAGQDPGLSEAGRAHAEQLAAWFGKNAPRAIYVSATRRARETAAPLAAKLKLVLKEYAPGDLGGVVERAKAERGAVLIVGHSNTVPEIVERLGGTRPADIADDRFGDIWHVGPGGRTEKKSLGGR